MILTALSLLFAAAIAPDETKVVIQPGLAQGDRAKRSIEFTSDSVITEQKWKGGLEPAAGTESKSLGEVRLRGKARLMDRVTSAEEGLATELSRKWQAYSRTTAENSKSLTERPRPKKVVRYKRADGVLKLSKDSNTPKGDAARLLGAPMSFDFEELRSPGPVAVGSSWKVDGMRIWCMTNPAGISQAERMFEVCSTIDPEEVQVDAQSMTVTLKEITEEDGLRVVRLGLSMEWRSTRPWSTGFAISRGDSTLVHSRSRGSMHDNLTGEVIWCLDHGRPMRVDLKNESVVDTLSAIFSRKIGEDVPPGERPEDSMSRSRRKGQVSVKTRNLWN